jgi:membrane-associated HD superfamily phosphohydrolase
VPGSVNPHEGIDPYESSTIIIRHVPEGIVLARKHRLPERIIDFIAEHHGTTATRYQYAKAVQAAGGDTSQVSLDDFRYPGPRPRSRETALVLIADGCEARARAERPKTEEDLRALIKDVIDKRLAGNQFDETNLTMRDLNTILESFTGTLRGIYHPRIEYPNTEEPKFTEETGEEAHSVLGNSSTASLSSEPPSQNQTTSNEIEKSLPETSASAIPAHDPSTN